MRWLLVLPLAITPGAGTPAEDSAIAAPDVILFYDGPLVRRVYLTNWEENFRFMLAVNEPDKGGKPLDHERPQIKVALFWHAPTGRRVAWDSASLERLNPCDAQPARFLPAYRDLAPKFDYPSAGWQPGVRRITPEGLDILRAHAIPVRLD